MKVNFADVKLGAFVDDRSIRAKTWEAMDGALEMTGKLDTSIGQELSIFEPYGMATTQRARRMLKGVRVGDAKVRLDTFTMRGSWGRT